MCHCSLGVTFKMGQKEKLPFKTHLMSQSSVRWWSWPGERVCVSGCVLVFALECVWMSASVFVLQQHHHIFLWHTLCSKRRQKWRMEKRKKKCWLWQKPFWKATLSLFSHVLIQKRKYQLQRNVPTAALFSLSHTQKWTTSHTAHHATSYFSNLNLLSDTSFIISLNQTFIFTWLLFNYSHWFDI